MGKQRQQQNENQETGALSIRRFPRGSAGTDVQQYIARLRRSYPELVRVDGRDCLELQRDLAGILLERHLISREAWPHHIISHYVFWEFHKDGVRKLREVTAEIERETNKFHKAWRISLRTSGALWNLKHRGIPGAKWPTYERRNRRAIRLSDVARKRLTAIRLRHRLLLDGLTLGNCSEIGAEIYFPEAVGISTTEIGAYFDFVKAVTLSNRLLVPRANPKHRYPALSALFRKNRKKSSLDLTGSNATGLKVDTIRKIRSRSIASLFR